MILRLNVVNNVRKLFLNLSLVIYQCTLLDNYLKRRTNYKRGKLFVILKSPIVFFFFFWAHFTKNLQSTPIK